MEHLIFLFNLITLAVGLAVAAGLYRDSRATPGPLAFWHLAHFAGFTFTMAVAAVDAYALVNLDPGTDLSRYWSALVLVGCATMTVAFPHLCRWEGGRPPTPPFTQFWASLALVPLAGAVGVFLVAELPWLLTILAIAGLPFGAAIVYGLAVSPGHSPGSFWEGWGAFGILALVAAAEVGWILSHPPEGGYYFLTLPLAYLYNAWMTWKNRPCPLPAPDPTAAFVLALPEAWADAQSLTLREREVARGILRALSNKELAFELGLSENTIRNHIANLYRKLGIQKRLDLVVLVQKYQPR